MAWVLRGRGAAVAEVPRPRGRRIRRQVGEAHRQRRLAASRRPREVRNGGERWRPGHRHVVALRLCILPARIRGRQAHGIGARVGVLVARALRRRAGAVAEVPRPRGRRVRRQVGEVHRQRRLAASRPAREVRNGCVRGQHSHRVACAGRSSRIVGRRRGQSERVASSSVRGDRHSRKAHVLPPHRQGGRARDHRGLARLVDAIAVVIAIGSARPPPRRDHGDGHHVFAVAGVGDGD